MFCIPLPPFLCPYLIPLVPPPALAEGGGLVETPGFLLIARPPA